VVDRTTVGLQIDPKLNHEFTLAAPRGMKAETIRALIELLVTTQKQWVTDGRAEFVSDKLIRGQLKLIEK
jgi:hypothetical protein